MVGLSYLVNSDPTQLATYPGQAHFATDGNHTCRECVHWANQRGERTKYELSRARCQKAVQMMGEDTTPIPHNANACRHFQAAPAPPVI